MNKYTSIFLMDAIRISNVSKFMVLKFFGVTFLKK